VRSAVYPVWWMGHGTDGDMLWNGGAGDDSNVRSECGEDEDTDCRR